MKSLKGKLVMITRPEHQAGGLTAALESLGAEVAIVPVVHIAPPEDLRPLQRALRNLGSYDWVVFTSVNGVESVRTQMEELGIEAKCLSERKLAAIGPATGEALREVCRPPDLVPDEFVSEAIASAMPDVRGLRFLLARADLARKDLAQQLRAMGAEVEEVVAYRIVRSSDIELPDRRPDAITLTSSEIVRATFDLLTQKGKSAWMSEAALICIGPITAGAVTELGFEPAAVASQYDTQGLIAALVDKVGREVTHA